ncbi:hypothetical protein EIN_031640 [Entamoeba invadens IP1]|uniref:Uncharacterized protein n=1 Tax=Entamoeba invadens IP1 TaxID=370355 RepID=A0A0A1U1G7_ENTIV|nr:hypothetical protein EIN_031640 [Entamoeba invadens IP1]ELP86443.1 hypothetical protein EIN_031640 [Entamoeba invadens IP1]|eukprot:XP_004185789.1 hypothetical protein EIN_031640 [Entamoeba invadens IP1]
MSVIVSIPAFPNLKEERDILLFLPLYTTILARGSTQPLPITDNLVDPLALSLRYLPKTQNSLENVLTAIMNFSNRINQDTRLTVPVLKVLEMVDPSKCGGDDQFDTDVIVLSIAANCLFELKKTAQAVATSKFVFKWAERFTSLGEEKDEKVVKGYLALVLCGVAYVSKNVGKTIQVEWDEVLRILEEFAAFQKNCGALDEIGQRRLVDAMDVIEEIQNEKNEEKGKEKSEHKMEISEEKSDQRDEKRLKVEEENKGKERKLQRRMSFDSLTLNEIDCY